MDIVAALNDYLSHNAEQSESVTATCGNSISTEAYANTVQLYQTMRFPIFASRVLHSSHPL